MSNFQPSPQQAQFYEWVQTGQGSAILEAVAGSGKTTTLINGLSYMPGSVFFGAYNKKIADEIKAKAAGARGVFVGTMHSAGFSAFRRTYPKVQVDERKVAKIIDAAATLGGNSIGPDILPLKAFILKMVSFGKQFLLGVKCPIENKAVWKKLVEHFSAADDLPEDADLDLALDCVINIYSQSIELCPTIIDFDDMIFAPIAFNCRIYKNDWVLIDECQDINGARRELARRMLKPGGRLVAVGDSRQAIYGFTGAGADSIDLISKEFNCAHLPLTVTYRCPKKVVEYVHQWVSHIEAHESAKDGEVVTWGPGKIEDQDDKRPWFIQAQPSPSSAILCRYTKPLIENAYGMLRAGIACKVEGRDIGKGLVKLATRWKIKTLDALEKRLEKYLDAELAKAAAKDSEAAAQAVTDKVDTLRIFIERTREKGLFSIAALVAEIEALFADNVSGVCTLSTGHKSKGREWGDVYWLQAKLRTRRPLLDWEAEQERNLNYVIGTRAMDRLILIPEEHHKKGA